MKILFQLEDNKTSYKIAGMSEVTRRIVVVDLQTNGHHKLDVTHVVIGRLLDVTTSIRRRMHICVYARLFRLQIQRLLGDCTTNEGAMSAE